MYKHRRGARRDLWDAETNRTAEDDGNTNYNPFFTRVTRANRRLVATSNDTDSPLSKPNAPPGLGQDEADLEPPVTQPVHVALSHKRQLRPKCRIREGDTVRKFVEIGLAIVEHGPIGTSGPFLLNPLAHQRSIIFVEYGNRNPSALGKQGSLNGNHVPEPEPTLPDELAHIKLGPLESSETPDDIETMSNVMEPPTSESGATNEPLTSITTDLRSYEVVDDEYALELKVSDTRNKKPTGDVRLVHIQDDWRAFRRLFRNFFSLDFNRNRVNFLDWCIGNLANSNRHLPIRQTEFWRPVIDKSRNVIRTAFGIEYLVAYQPTSEPSRPSVATSAVHNIKDRNLLSENLPTSCLQKIAVFIQVNNRQGKELFFVDSYRKSLENYLMIFDKTHERITTKDLIPSPDTWKNLLEDFDLVNQPSGNAIAFAIVQIIFEAVARKWSDFILCIDNYIAVLEERTYSQPANDQWSSALWSITKQISEAERLIKFHLLLMEDIQNSMVFLVEKPFGPDWLSQNILEFKRLSNEIDESLKKPVANMIDLVYKSISIRDARQSLEINTSLWRLSWITFIFLPLTFLAGVFGMNVSEVRSYPSMKWYFIAAVPLMLLVMLSWLIVRNFVQRNIATQA